MHQIKRTPRGCFSNLVGVLGARSNHSFAGRIGKANQKRVDLLARHAEKEAVSPREVEQLHRPKIRGTLERLLIEQARPMRCLELMQLCGESIEDEAKRTSVKAALADLASDPSSPVVRLDRGLYGATATPKTADL